jgi:hypothetical protein
MNILTERDRQDSASWRPASPLSVWCQISTLPDLVIQFPAPVVIPIIEGRGQKIA